jgi:DNA-binding GntR family transcriptional regulator
MAAADTTGDGKGDFLTAIPHLSRKDRVVLRIREGIELGELKAGEALTEIGLARRLGVAQATIREALLQLEFTGFVERVGPRKTRITSLSREQIADIYLLRTRLETLAVELLAADPSADLRSCEDACREMLVQAHAGDYRAFYQADLEFHRALWKATKSRSLYDVLERLVPKLFAFGIIQHSRPRPEKLVEMAEPHRKLLELITERRVEEAKTFMERAMVHASSDDISLADGS